MPMAVSKDLLSAPVDPKSVMHHALQSLELYSPGKGLIGAFVGLFMCQHERLYFGGSRVMIYLV